MKKMITVLLALALVMVPTTVWAADADTVALELSASQVQRGGEIELNGTVSGSVKDVVVKIVSPVGTVFHLDVLTAEEGTYTASIGIPEEASLSPYGVYTVLAGHDTAQATARFSVVSSQGGQPGDDGDDDEDTQDDEEQVEDASPGQAPTAPGEIPSDAGHAEGSSVQPDRLESGQYVVGSEVLAEAMLQGQGEGLVTIQLPMNDDRSDSALVFPSEILQSLRESKVGLSIQYGDSTIQFPAGAIPADANEQALVRIVLNTDWTVTAQQLVNDSVTEPDYAPVGIVLSAVVQLITGDSVTEIHELEEPVEVSMNLTVEQLAQVQPELAGVYYVSGQDIEYVGGNLRGGMLTFTVDHFSYYALLEYDKAFVDLAGHWAEQQVKSLAAKHVVRGVDALNYAPERSITRAEFVTMVMRAMTLTGQATASAANPYHDVPDGQYYTDHVASASSMGIITGYDGQFRPDDAITREEAAVVLARAAAYLKLAPVMPGNSSFADEQSIADWAATSVEEAWTLGLIQGDGSRFHPQQLLTRAEVAAMLDRLLANQDISVMGGGGNQ